MNELLTYLTSLQDRFGRIQGDTCINLHLVDNVLVSSELHSYQGEYQWMRVLTISSKKSNTFILRVIHNTGYKPDEELIMFHSLESIKTFLKELYS